MKTLNAVVMLILIFGGIEVGALGLFDYDIIANALGPLSNPARIVEVVIGVCAIYGLFLLGPLMTGTGGGRTYDRMPPLGDARTAYRDREPRL